MNKLVVVVDLAVSPSSDHHLFICLARKQCDSWVKLSSAFDLHICDDDNHAPEIDFSTETFQTEQFITHSKPQTVLKTLHTLGGGHPPSF